MDPDTFASSTVLPVALRKEDRDWAMIAHLGAFAGHVFPFAHLRVPLAVWLLRRDTSAFVDDQGREAINAQISSVTIYAAVGVVLCFLLIGILYVANFILVILAAIAASEGKTYRYPFILRLIK